MADPSPCAHYEEDYSALIDGELAPARAAEVRDHVGGCARCRARLAALGRVDRVLGEVPLPALSEDLPARLRARIDDAPATPPNRAVGRAPRRRLPAVAAAAVVVLAAGVGFYVGSSRRAAAPDPALAEGRTAAPDPALPGAALPPGDGGLDRETLEDQDVIANLELLEAFVALDGETS